MMIRSVEDMVRVRDELIGQFVCVEGTLVHGNAAAGDYLIGESDTVEPFATRVRLSYAPPERRYPFRQLFTAGSGRPGGDNAHFATVTVCGRLRPPSAARFAAELGDLQWATFAYAIGAGNPAMPPYEERHALDGPHPGLEPGLWVRHVITMRAALAGKVVRTWGLLVIPHWAARHDGQPFARLAATLADAAEPSTRVRVERPPLEYEQAAIVRTPTDLEVDRHVVARCIVSGVLYPDPTGEAVALLRHTSEVCLSAAPANGAEPQSASCFGVSGDLPTPERVRAAML